MTNRNVFRWPGNPFGLPPSDDGLRRRIEALVRKIEGPGQPHVQAAAAEVQSLEIDLGLPLPADYREFLLLAGGPTSPSWRGLWRVHEVLSLNRHLPVFQWFQGLIGFGNEGFVVYALDYRGGPLPVVVSVGLSASEPEDIVSEAGSFVEWLEGTLPE